MKLVHSVGQNPIVTIFPNRVGTSMSGTGGRGFHYCDPAGNWVGMMALIYIRHFQ